MAFLTPQEWHYWRTASSSLKFINNDCSFSTSAQLVLFITNRKVNNTVKIMMSTRVTMVKVLFLMMIKYNDDGINDDDDYVLDDDDADD